MRRRSNWSEHNQGCYYYELGLGDVVFCFLLLIIFFFLLILILILVLR
jgi:hypothetical protein